MPRTSKKVVSKTAVGAERRGAEAVKAALSKMEMQHPEAPEFYSVQRVQGNGNFTIRNAAGKDFRGVGGHGGGKARISVGQIILAEYSATPEQGLEILALIDDRKQAAMLVKNGFMKQTVINAALTAGAVSTAGAQVEEVGYVFEEDEVDVNAL